VGSAGFQGDAAVNVARDAAARLGAAAGASWPFTERGTGRGGRLTPFTRAAAVNSARAAAGASRRSQAHPPPRTLIISRFRPRAPGPSRDRLHRRVSASLPCRGGHSRSSGSLPCRGGHSSSPSARRLLTRGVFALAAEAAHSFLPAATRAGATRASRRGRFSPRRLGGQSCSGWGAAPPPLSVLVRYRAPVYYSGVGLVLDGAERSVAQRGSRTVL